MKTKLIRSIDVVWEEMEGQALLVHTPTGERWTLNAAALALWKRCDGTQPADTLAQTLASMTRRNFVDCRDELEGFVQALTGIGLLQGAGVEVKSGSAQPAQFSIGMLRAMCQGKNLGGSRRRPSPRGNGGPG